MTAYGDTDALLVACRLISCIFSMIGATAIILSYVFFKDSRTFGRKLLLVLSTQDLALSLFYILPGEAGYGICKFQSIILTFFSCSSVIWTSVIAFHVFKSVNSGPVEHHEKLMHIICWAYASACAIGVALLGSAPTAAGWCWVPDSSVEVGLIRLALYYIPLWLIWAFNAVTYAYVHFKIRRMLTLGVSQKQLKHIHAVNRLIFVPIVLVLLRIPGSINRTYVLAVGNGTIYPLTVLQALGDPAQGFADALLFGAFSKRLFRRIFAKMRGIDIENQELTSVTSSSKSNGGLTDTAEAEAMLGEDGLVDTYGRGSGATSPASTLATTVRSVFSSRQYEPDRDDTDTQTQTPYSAML